MNDFKTDLEYSKNANDSELLNKFYHKFFPGIIKIEEVEDLTLQKTGIDKIMHFKGGMTITVEEKKRRVVYGDVALETKSVVKGNYEKPGWIFTCQSDFIAYAIMPTRKIYMLPTGVLKLSWMKNFYEWEERFETKSASNQGYHTEFVPIPKEVLFNSMGEEMQFSFDF